MGTQALRRIRHSGLQGPGIQYSTRMILERFWMMNFHGWVGEIALLPDCMREGEGCFTRVPACLVRANGRGGGDTILSFFLAYLALQLSILTILL